VLTDAGETFLAGHEVRLDETAWQFEAFTDLQGYLSWHAAPDQRTQDETRITAELGAWIGTQVLGPVADTLADAAPATVRVVLPREAHWLAFRPLELAHANHQPLATQDITLVMDTGTGRTRRKAAMGDRLRVLGLFSLPEGGQPLNLRRERQALVKLIQGIDATGRAAEVRVLQYGVTRDRLRDVLEEAEGWDVIHISGHGAPGEILLETAAGTPDRITATELADLLNLARERVALVTVSACWSASQTAAQQRRLLGLPVPTQALAPEQSRSSPSSQPDSGTLATELSTRLGCAVLAMRYPVDDEFAIALSEKLYDLLADKAQPLPRAVGLALRQLAGDYPALSVATPALFGARAVDLRLAAPKWIGTRSGATTDLKMAGFPPQPDRFVGRTVVMAHASAALAAGSGVPGVLLHGMPGAGKTACALELAFGHEHAFEQFVWYKAPDEGMAIDGALTDFALTLERYLSGFQMAHELVSAETLTRLLPRLTELMERRRLLIVIDNAESLLIDDGQWRDDRWGQVVGALTGHTGLGRVILTNRRAPTGLTGLVVESVDALSADEALLLAREFPNLRKLSRGEIPGIERRVARRLARRALELAQGHPKLLELAEGQASRPERLAKLVETGDQAWREQGGLPEGFFTTGPTSTEYPAAAEVMTSDAADYWHVLAAWTEAVADTLSPGERDLFWFLCCLEEPDRQRWVLDNNWANLWHRLGRMGEPPELDHALADVAATALVVMRPKTEDADVSCALHPGVAEAGRNRAGKLFRDVADTEAAMFWAAVYQQASGASGKDTVDTRLLVRAGLAAVPYLIRQQQWEDSAALLEGAFLREPSRANATAMLPAIMQTARHDPRQKDVLARVLQVLDPVAAEAVMRDAFDAAVTAGEYRTASGIAARLVNLCLDNGRLREALDLTERMMGYSRQAGLGPWSQLSDEGQRLQVLNQMGHSEHVLAEVTRLRHYMDTLPATPGPHEIIPPWNVREALLNTGHGAALQLRRWHEALDLSAAVTASKRDRNADATDIARTRFNDYRLLLRLGRADEALDLLQDCLRNFQDAHDTMMIGYALSGLADTENDRGHGAAAVDLERSALRYSYLVGDVVDIAISYHNHGDYLRRHAPRPAQALASHLTAALILTFAGSSHAEQAIKAASTDLRELGPKAVPPSDVTNLQRQLGDIPGTDLPALLTALSPDPQAAEQALRDLIAKAQELASTPPAEDSPDLADDAQTAPAPPGT
jgi:tetratricopeptide (TPR) repeat protein